MKTIGVGVIGTAFMGKAHSIAYSTAGVAFGATLRPSLEIVCDYNPNVASNKRAEMGFARCTSNYMDVINDPKVQLISICVPNAVHKEIAVAALAARKHVWCEKPMATTLSDSQAMADAANNSNQQTIVGYNYTQNPIVQTARDLLEEGVIGEITGFFWRLRY
jgi:predicted dehydrogenase